MTVPLDADNPAQTLELRAQARLRAAYLRSAAEHEHAARAIEAANPAQADDHRRAARAARAAAERWSR